MNHREEQKWIRNIKLFGSKKDAELLVRAYYDEIYQFCRLQLSDEHAACDLTQEIFISVLSSIGTYRKDKAGFRTWLYRAATHKVIDHRRRAVPESASLDDTELVDDRSDFVKRTEQRELLERIERYVSGYSVSVQEIFRLHIYGDYTFAEIARMLDMPESTVKSDYYRLSKKIREEFHDE